jgi:hypothetical protein
MPPNLLASAKKKIQVKEASVKKKFEAKEGEIRGGAWKSPLTTKDGDWKSYGEWETHYEPKKENKEKKPDSERKKQAKEKFQAKLKNTILLKLHDGVAKKILLILLEVASKLLTKAQEMSAKLPSSATELSDLVPKLLNECNGIILGYRFDNKDKAASKRKFAYLRREASNQLTDIFYGIATKAQGEARNLQSAFQQLQGEMREILESKQHFVKAEISQRLDELLSTGVTKFDEKVETKLDQAESKLADLEVKANAILGATGIAKPNAEDAAPSVRSSFADLEVKADAILGATGIAKPNAENVAATVQSNIRPRQEMKDQRDELLSHFGGMVKEMIASKMEELTQKLLEMLNNLCRIFGKALEKTDTEKQEKDQVQEDMFGALESSYAKIQNSVSDEVQKVIDMLGGMMAPPKEDEEDEEDDEDDDDDDEEAK